MSEQTKTPSLNRIQFDGHEFILKSYFDAQALEIEKLKATIEILYSKQSQHESTVLATVAERDRLRAELAEHKDCREISKTLGDLLNNQQSKLDRLSQANEKLKRGLEFYANGEHLNGNDYDEETLVCEGSSMVDHVVGKTARLALADAAKLESESGE